MSNQDLLTFKMIETEYPNSIKASTLSVWKCTHRYGFDKICLKIGRLVRVKRIDWEAFLDSCQGGSGVCTHQ